MRNLVGANSFAHKVLDWRNYFSALAVLLLVLALPFPALSAGRHVSLVIDTSSSMNGNDPRRYTLQLTQILADLLDQGDSLTVIRMPGTEGSCGGSADSSLALQWKSDERPGFQTMLDRMLAYDTGTYFAVPIHTAMADLARHKEKSRLLLFLADSGGLGPCGAVLTEELSRLKAEGVMIAAINLGGAGAFDHNPAFSFTTGAMDARELANAVGQVYQQFIGGKEVKTGVVHDIIEVEIQPLARQAYLVVVADGEMGGVESLDGNPAAAEDDHNHKGGGHAVGLDGLRRDYRIVRLGRPEAGRWRFRVYGLSAPAGWMLLQDSALALRLVSSPKLAQGLTAPMEVELYDQDTGQRVADASRWPGLTASMAVDGQAVRFLDDGSNGDQKAGDGIYTALLSLGHAGKHRASLKLESQTLNRLTDLELDVEAVVWRLQAQVPARVGIDSPVTLTVEAQASPDAIAPVPLQNIEVTGSGGEKLASLRDDGQGGDPSAGDNRYTGVWTPRQAGDQSLRFTGVGGGPAQSLTVPVRVVGTLQLPDPIPVALGKTGSNSESQGRLDLTGTLVKGEYPLEVSSDFAASNSVLEIDLGQGWVALDASPKPLVLSQTGHRQWPLRLRVGDCSGGVSAGQAFAIELKGTDADGQPLSHKIPLTLEIVEDPWLHCWWPLLAAGAGALLAGIVVHGFWSPSRFSGRLGVVISPEEDMNEGFFHPIRAQRGTGSGFYRDARAYIRQDYRLSGSAKAALACLRASGKRVQIKPAAGMPLYRLNMDGEWEALPAEETPVHFGVAYKDSMGSLFFEIRNG